MGPLRSAEEQQELDDLFHGLSTLVESLGIDSIHLTYLRSIYHEGNLDCLRCFQYVLATPEPRLFFIIEKCQQAIESCLHREASIFLTPEMVSAALRIHYALQGSGTSSNLSELYSLLFTNMHEVWNVLSLVEDHGITDPSVIQFVLATKPLVHRELWQRSDLPEELPLVNNVDEG